MDRRAKMASDVKAVLIMLVGLVLLALVDYRAPTVKMPEAVDVAAGSAGPSRESQ